MFQSDVTLNLLTQWCVYQARLRAQQHTSHVDIVKIYEDSMRTFQRLMHKTTSDVTTKQHQERFQLAKPHLLSFLKENATHRTLWGFSRADYFLGMEDYSFLDTPDCITFKTLRHGGCLIEDLPPLGSVTDRRHKNHRRQLQFLFDYYGIQRVYFLHHAGILSTLLNEMVIYFPTTDTVQWENTSVHHQIDTLVMTHLVMKTTTMFTTEVTLDVIVEEIFAPASKAYRDTLKENVLARFHPNLK